MMFATKEMQETQVPEFVFEYRSLPLSIQALHNGPVYPNLQFSGKLPLNIK